MALLIKCTNCDGKGCLSCDYKGSVIQYDRVLVKGTGYPTIDPGLVSNSYEGYRQICDAPPAQVTHHCPACEAAARERVICACGDEIGQAERIGLSQIGAICGNCAVGRKDYDARMELADLRARLAATENVALALGAMNHPPCFICGYNGPSYYQPEVHLCAERHHKYYYGKLTAFSELRALLAEGGEK